MGKSKSKEKKQKKKAGDETERHIETQMIQTNLTDRRLTFGVDESKLKTSMKKINSLETAENVPDQDENKLTKSGILKKLEELEG